MMHLYVQKVHVSHIVDGQWVRDYGLPDFTNKDWWDNMVSSPNIWDRIQPL